MAQKELSIQVPTQNITGTFSEPVGLDGEEPQMLSFDSQSVAGTVPIGTELVHGTAITLTIPPSNEHVLPDSETAEIQHSISVSEHTGVVVIDGRNITFVRPYFNATFKLFVHLLKEGRFLSSEEISEWIKEHANIKTQPSQLVKNLRGKIEEDDKNPGILVTKWDSDGKTSYGISNATIDFAKEDQRVITRASQSAANGAGFNTKDNTVNSQTSLHRRLRRSQPHIIGSLRTSGSSEIKDNLEQKRAKDFKINIVNALLLQMVLNDSTSYTIHDLKKFLSQNLPGYGSRLNDGGRYDYETVEGISGANTPEEMGSFLLDTLEEIMDEYWNIDSDKLNDKNDREKQVAESLKKLSRGFVDYSPRKNGGFENGDRIVEGALPGDIINTVSEHFGIPLRDKYREEYVTRNKRRKIKLYREPEDKRRVRQPSTGKIKL